jgi:hypothetical protein
MQINIAVRGFDGIHQALNTLREDLSDKAASAALNKIGAKAQTEMKRAITAEYNLKSNEVSSRLSLSRANKNNLRVALDPFASGRRGRSLNLIHFLEKKVTMAQARRRAKGGKLYAVGLHGQMLPILYFKIKKNGPAKPIPGTFIGNNGRTVFMRVGKSRLPIKAKATIDVPQMFTAKKTQDRVLAVINREMPIEFDRAIKLVLDKFNRR